MNDESKNLLLAVVISLIILIGYQYFIERPRMERLAEQQRQQQLLQKQNETNTAQIAPQLPVTRTEAITKAPRISFANAKISGSINLQGGRIDDVSLSNYRIALDKDSETITLLSPSGTMQAYYADFGWLANEGITVPDSNTLWQSTSERLTENNPVTLQWDNGEGLLFKIHYSLDEHYLIKVTQEVENTGNSAVSLYPFGLVSRTKTEINQKYIAFTGPLGVFNRELSEIKYNRLLEKREINKNSAGGWIGISDDYWLVSLLPDQASNWQYRFTGRDRSNHAIVQVDFQREEALTIPAGGRIQDTAYLFAGAKELTVIDAYSKELNIPLFDRTIDFGMFYFLTKPLFQVLHWLYLQVGNFGVAIILLTCLVRLALAPLAHKSYKSMLGLKKLQPEMMRLKEKFGDDRMGFSQEVMRLYKREKVNPASGCLPILLQIPVFFALYKVLLLSIEMRHAPFFGWIQDLAAPDPTAIFNLFGLLPYDVPQILQIGVWPCLVGLTMWLSYQFQPKPTDKIQEAMFKMFPIMFGIISATFPAGLAVYWTFNNILSIIQQKFIKWMADKAEKNNPKKQSETLPALESPKTGKKK